MCAMCFFESDLCYAKQKRKQEKQKSPNGSVKTKDFQEECK